MRTILGSCSSFGDLVLPSVHLLLHLWGDGYQALKNPSRSCYTDRYCILTPPLCKLVCAGGLTWLHSAMCSYRCHAFELPCAFKHGFVFKKKCVCVCLCVFIYPPWLSMVEPLSESSCWWISLLKSAVPAVRRIKDYQLQSTLQRAYWCKWMCSSASYPFSQGLSDCGTVAMMSLTGLWLTWLGFNNERDNVVAQTCVTSS